MRILLINPPNVPSWPPTATCIEGMFCSFLDGRITRMFSIDNLGISSLATYLRRGGHEAATFDACVKEASVRETLETALSSGCELVGLSGPQAAFHEVRWLATEMRARGYDGHIVAGGCFATLNAARILTDVPAVDYVIRGDGEISLLMLADTLVSGGDPRRVPNCVCRHGGSVVEGPIAPLDLDRDSLPPPAREWTSVALSKTGTVGIGASAGCGYAKCSFCSPGRISRESANCWRPRVVERVVEELESVLQSYKPSFVSFIDEDFLGWCKTGKARATDIFRRLNSLNQDLHYSFACRADEVDRDTFAELKKCGLAQVFIGFESFIDSRLRRFNKGTTAQTNARAIDTLRELDLYVIPGHILYDPYVTFEEVCTEVAAYRALDFYSLTKLTKSLYVLPETAVWERLNAESALDGIYDAYSYVFADRRVSVLRGCLAELQSRLHPVFLECYRMLKRMPESTAISRPVKEQHLLIFDEMYSAVRLGPDPAALSRLIEEGTSALMRTLRTAVADYARQAVRQDSQLDARGRGTQSS